MIRIMVGNLVALRFPLVKLALLPKFGFFD